MQTGERTRKEYESSQRRPGYFLWGENHGEKDEIRLVITTRDDKPRGLLHREIRSKRGEILQTKIIHPLHSYVSSQLPELRER